MLMRHDESGGLIHSIIGVLAMPTFPQYFGMEGDPDYIARVKGDVVALLQAGCCVGALLINFLAGNGYL